jgi:hypothetical protein
MARFQYSVITKATPALAWEVFSNWHRWNHFANIYGEIRWRDGQPWTPGSLMQIELLRPVNTVVDHVITGCIPAKKVSWIDHALGVAMAQWVSFEERPSQGTRVHTWGDIIHSGVMIAGHPVDDLVASFTETWYQNFRVTCDRLAGSTTPTPAGGSFLFMN